MKRRGSHRPQRTHNDNDRDDNCIPSASVTLHDKNHSTAVLKRIEKHRASASGHVDGTVSDC